jgi:hypothetical protein
MAYRRGDSAILLQRPQQAGTATLFARKSTAQKDRSATFERWSEHFTPDRLDPFVPVVQDSGSTIR